MLAVSMQDWRAPWPRTTYVYVEAGRRPVHPACMFRFFERLLIPTAIPPEAPPPALAGRRGLLRFYWHFVRQARGLIAALFVAGLLVALLDVAIPAIIGRVVGLVTQGDRATMLTENWPVLAGMAAVLLVLRPGRRCCCRMLVTNQAIDAGLTNLIRWQSHWHVVRQSWTFFQNDFAGRIANRVMQTGPALRESVVAATNAVWYIVVYGTSAVLLLAHTDWRLAMPMLVWFVGYARPAALFRAAHARPLAAACREVRSALTGRIVDSYTNILTVKLFARARDEDNFVREAVDEHTDAFRAQLRMITPLRR